LGQSGGDTVTATFTTNTGDRAGADVPRLYLAEAAGDQRVRLLGSNVSSHNRVNRAE